LDKLARKSPELNTQVPIYYVHIGRAIYRSYHDNFALIRIARK